MRMIENALVKQVFYKDGSDESFLLLDVKRQASSCDSCSQEAGCSQSTFAKLMAPKVVEIELPNHVGARQGDWVKLEVPDEIGLLASVLAFGLPMFFMIFFPGMMSLIIENASDGYLAIASGFGIFLGIGVSRALSNRTFSNPKFAPRVKGIALLSQ